MALDTFGCNEDQPGFDNALKTMKSALQLLNGHLNDRAWIVGDKITLVDIVTFNALLIPFSIILDVNFRDKVVPNAAAWFLKMSKLPVVTRTAGYVNVVGVGAAQQSASGAQGGKQEGGKGGKETPKKEEAKAAAAEEEEFDKPFSDDADAAAAEAIKKKAAEAADIREISLAIIKSYGAMQEIFQFLTPLEVQFFQKINSFMYRIGVPRCQMNIRCSKKLYFTFYTDINDRFRNDTVYIVSQY